MSFFECEKRERDLLKYTEHIYPNSIRIIKMSEPSSFCHYDAFIEYKGNKALIEIKVRDVSLHRYKTAYIEQAKVKRLLIKADQLGHIECYYFAFYPKDSKLLIYDLRKDEYKIETIYCNKFTAAGGASGEKINKKMATFEIEKAAVLDISKELYQQVIRLQKEIERLREEANLPKQSPLF